MQPIEVTFERQILDEGAITMSQAAALLPHRRGKKRHASTIYRYVTEGVSGVRLEGVKLPDGWVTSRQAIERFLRALTDEATATLLAQERARRSPMPLSNATKKAMAAMDKAGIGVKKSK